MDDLPLRKGSGKKVRSENVGKLMTEYARSGKIGRITPKSKEHAMEIAAAIAHRNQREESR